MSMPKTPQAVPDPKLRAKINASLDAAIVEADRFGYVSLEEADRKAAALLRKLDAEFPDRVR